MSTSRPLVLVSWNGSSEPWSMLELDAPAQFDWVLFDYSGSRPVGHVELRGQRVQVLGQETECKGEIYQALAAYLSGLDLTPEYVSLIDDDVLISVSAINKALHVARCTGLDVFSPTLSHDSLYSHRWMLSQSTRLVRQVDWVEVMMPYYRGGLFRAGQEHYAGNTSSWGIDRYLMPTLQKMLGMESTGLLDCVVASHCRPVTSGGKVYRNGLTAREEAAHMKKHCLAIVDERMPDIVRTDWYKRIFVRRRVYTRWQQLKYGLGRPLRRWLGESM